MYSRTVDDYDKMSLCGIEAVVEPSFWLGINRRSPHTFFDYFLHLLEFEPQRAQKYGIEHYSCIAVNPKEANNLELAIKVIGGMAPYLEHPRCLALGEVGLNENTDAEVDVMRRQLRLAREKGLPVMIHTPHTRKKTGTDRIVQVLREEGMDPEYVLIDHNTEETIEITLEYGAWAGMTVYPGKITSERAVAMLQKYGTNRMMINSSADWSLSDPLSVPRTCRKMRETGFPESEINKVIWKNPYDFYARSGKLKRSEDNL